ncbi:MAG TPA: sialate O-acetylesterase [Treponema sp.]|nr:sialate O-acetylesterase [Treponema sp.]
MHRDIICAIYFFRGSFMAFSIAAVFSDNCVLQREKPISVFGTGAECGKVTVALKDGSGAVVSQNSAKSTGEKWIVTLPPLPAMENLTLCISGPESETVFKNVAIGEVWLAGGQSNMEFELHNCTEGPDAMKKEPGKSVRFYYTQKNAWKDDKFFEDEKNTCWETEDSKGKAAWSAVGYFFAEQLAKDLGVTVGIIGCNWGGTSASSWMSTDRLARDKELHEYLDTYERESAGKSVEEQCREYLEYEAYHNEWQKKYDDLVKVQPGINWNDAQKIIGVCRYPGPKNCRNPYRPGALWDCMIQRVAPYTIKGFIYYQGESDDHLPHLYYRLFREMIDQWRCDWKDDTLPFLFVQLPEHRNRMDKDTKNWCLIREAQEKIASTIANTALAPALGLGAYDDIHPKSKKEIALRLEKLALSEAYGLSTKKASFAPRLSNALSCDGKMILTFRYADEGFVFREDNERLEHYKYMEDIQHNTVSKDFSVFELAGSDKVFHPAKCTPGSALGKMNTLTLESPEVPEPVYARYAWFNYCPVTVFGRNGLPLLPFRTDGDL